MSTLPLQLQIVSDLHLETPLTSPSYTTFELDVQANNLCLLGDIGLVKDEGLFVFLRATLDRSRGTRIFYILGNHEAYQLSYELAVKKLRDFEEEVRSEYGGRFILLDRDRYDLDASNTILGCTLWSAVSLEQADEAQLRLTDFNEDRGIRKWNFLKRNLIDESQSLHIIVRPWTQELQSLSTVGALYRHASLQIYLQISAGPTLW
ncbi:hypothetical protein N0V90_008040 [Kalmusia sp. IMI 367209]|nr:hypothetical protein N0V90_008040 [Kalmusia sp. IMI 367209]